MAARSGIGKVNINERILEGQSTTAQAIFSTVALDLASITDSMIDGYLCVNVGMVVLFQFFSLLGLASLAVFLLAGKRRVIFAGG